MIDLLINGKRPVSSISDIFSRKASAILFKNYIEMREVMGQPGQRLLTATEKNGEFGRNKTVRLFFLNLLFFALLVF